MKNLMCSWLSTWVLPGLLLTGFYSCKKADTPAIETAAVKEVTNISALSGGIITGDGGASVIARGVCWSEAMNPTIAGSKSEDGSGAGDYISSITGLEPNSTYYLRAYATNSEGTSYGGEISFRTYNDYIFDIDGNGYGTVIIADQEWIADNLKTTTYNNGIPIAELSEDNSWAETSGGAFCWYENNRVTYGNAYGALYNWYSVNTGNLCPVGWHVPTNDEWSELVQNLDPGSTVYISFTAGGRLKGTRMAPFEHPRWNGPNKDATDEFGFSAYPGGYRDLDGTFDLMFYANYLWSSSAESDLTGWCRVMSTYDGNIGRSFLNKQDGFSVRCLRD